MNKKQALSLIGCSDISNTELMNKLYSERRELLQAGIDKLQGHGHLERYKRQLEQDLADLEEAMNILDTTEQNLTAEEITKENPPKKALQPDSTSLFQIYIESLVSQWSIFSKWVSRKLKFSNLVVAFSLAGMITCLALTLMNQRDIQKLEEDSVCWKVELAFSEYQKYCARLDSPRIKYMEKLILQMFSSENVPVRFEIPGIQDTTPNRMTLTIGKYIKEMLPASGFRKSSNSGTLVEDLRLNSNGKIKELTLTGTNLSESQSMKYDNFTDMNSGQGTLNN